MVYRQTFGGDSGRPERVIRQLAGSKSVYVTSSAATSAAAFLPSRSKSRLEFFRLSVAGDVLQILVVYEPKIFTMLFIRNMGSWTFFLFCYI